MPRAPRQDRSGLTGWARHDVGLYLAAAGTSVVGGLLVWSATARTEGTAYLVRHLLAALVGLALAVLVEPARAVTGPDGGARRLRAGRCSPSSRC